MCTLRALSAHSGGGDVAWESTAPGEACARVTRARDGVGRPCARLEDGARFACALGWSAWRGLGAERSRAARRGARACDGEWRGRGVRASLRARELEWSSWGRAREGDAARGAVQRFYDARQLVVPAGFLCARKGVLVLGSGRPP